MLPKLKLSLLVVSGRAAKALAKDSRGFTLIELLVAIAIVGILAGIAALGWQGFIERHRLNKSRSELFQALAAAKSNATRDKQTWQFSLQEKNDFVQWSIHRASSSEFIPAAVLNNEAYWHHLERDVRIDPETTIRMSNQQRRVLFNPYGCPVYNTDDECGSTSLQALGRITLQPQKGGKLKRCIIFSTVIGAMRLAKERPKPSDGKYCY